MFGIINRMLCSGMALLTVLTIARCSFPATYKEWNEGIEQRRQELDADEQTEVINVEGEEAIAPSEAEGTTPEQTEVIVEGEEAIAPSETEETTEDSEGEIVPNPSTNPDAIEGGI